MNNHPNSDDDLDFDKLEISDPELKEIENMKSDDELDIESSFNEKKKENLEQEISKISMMGRGKNPTILGSLDPEIFVKPMFNLSTEILFDREKKYHPIDNFFGQIIDEELKHYIPLLKNECMKSKESHDFSVFLLKKEGMLQKIAQVVGEKRVRGEINDQKYLEMLQNALLKNQKTHVLSVQEKVEPETITRIFDRIEIMRKEIKKLGGIVPLYEEPKQIIQQKQVETQIIKKNTSENVQTGKINSSPIKNVQQNQNNVKSEHFSQDPLIIILNEKIHVYKSFQKYLETNFVSQREADIKDVTEKITKMENMIDLIKKNPGKLTKEKLETTFPNLTNVVIMGMDRATRNKMLINVAVEAKKDIEQIKDNKTAEAFKTHCGNIFERINVIKESDNMPMPIISRKEVLIPSSALNPTIKPGDLVVNLINIKMPIPKRYFIVNVNFDYNGVSFNNNFGANDDNGFYRRKFVFSLDKGKILKKLAKTSMTITVSKKHFFSAQLIGSHKVSFDKLLNYCDLPLTVEIPYKNSTHLILNLEISITKALDLPLKPVNWLVIEKEFPIFKPPVFKTEKLQQNDIIETKPQQKNSTSDQNFKKDVDIKNNQSPSKVKTPLIANPQTNNDNTNVNKQQTFQSKYKYPILSAVQKTQLSAIVGKNGLDASYTNYQINSFCVTFLEEFEAEIEKQIADFVEKDDSNSRKDAEQLLITATKYKNYLGSNLQDGKMTMDDYKGKIEAFVKLDDQFIAFFDKIGYSQSSYFVRNRKVVMVKELEDLAKM